MPVASRRLLVSFLALVALGACECGPTGPGPGPRGDAGSGRPIEAAPKLAESEPNDDPSRATAFRLIPEAPGSPLFENLKGELSGPGDVDWLRLPAQADRPGRSLAVTSDGDVALRWTASADATTDLKGPGEGEEAQNLAGPAVITIAVVPGSAAGPYPIKYEVSLNRGLAGAIEAETGADTALELEFPGEMQGVFNYRGDTDKWAIATGEGVVRFEYTPPPDVATTVKLARNGAVFDVVEMAAQKAGDDGVRPLVRPNLAGGSFTVELELDSDVPGVAAAYSLRMLGHAPVTAGTALEAEPSGIDAPTALGANTKALGYLHDLGDKDRFTRTVSEPEAPEGEDAPPWVLRAGLAEASEGVRFGVENEGDIVPAGTGRVCNRIVRPGELVVDVDLAPGEEPALPLKYTLDVTLRPAKDEEVEPNHKARTATKAPLASELKGFLHPVGDKDYWLFEVSAAPDVKKETAGLSNLVAGAGLAPTPGAGLSAIEIQVTAPEIDAELEILDEDGAPVAKANATGLGGTEKIKVDLPAGKYFAVVRPVMSGASACGQPYTLHINPR
jgi:hypothetical protein